jgi:hypothetical protein
MSPTPPFLPGKQLSNVYAFLLFEKYKFMLTFKPLKTKALITPCIIRQKRSFLNTGEFPSNCRLTGLVSMQTSKIRLMIFFSMMPF